MQEVNEAWRILRDPKARASYDNSLGMKPARAPRAERAERPAATTTIDGDEWDPDLDTPFSSPLARPGDVAVSVARALPWLVVAIVLGAIFVFTAFARDSGDGTSTKPDDLVGKCVSSAGDGMIATPCVGPNEGKVTSVQRDASACPSGSSARASTDGRWLCLEPVSQGITGTTGPPSPSVPSATTRSGSP